MGERRVEVFFYGLFMDEELLRGKGPEPEGGEVAAIDGFALRIGQRAALVPTPGVKVFGVGTTPHRGFDDRRDVPADLDTIDASPLNLF